MGYALRAPPIYVDIQSKTKEYCLSYFSARRRSAFPDRAGAGRAARAYTDVFTACQEKQNAFAQKNAPSAQLSL